MTTDKLQQMENQLKHVNEKLDALLHVHVAAKEETKDEGCLKIKYCKINKERFCFNLSVVLNFFWCSFCFHYLQQQSFIFSTIIQFIVYLIKLFITINRNNKKGNTCNNKPDCRELLFIFYCFSCK